MNLREFYDAVFGSYQEAIDRFQSEALVTRFVLKFLEDPSFGELESALAAGSTKDAFRAAHTLKGVAMNLSLTKLGEVSSAMTELLRAERLGEAQDYLPQVKAAYDVTVEALKKLG